MRDIKNHFKDYHKPVRVNNFWSNNYTEYKINSVRNKTLPVEEYFDKSRPYSKDIINELEKPDTRKI